MKEIKNSIQSQSVICHTWHCHRLLSFVTVAVDGRNRELLTQDHHLLFFFPMAFSQPFPLAAPLANQKTSYGPDLSVKLICPECRDPHPNIREEFGAGDLVCGNCGLVLGDRIVDTRSEWRVSSMDCPITWTGPLIYLLSTLDICQR